MYPPARPAQKERDETRAREKAHNLLLRDVPAHTKGRARMGREQNEPR